MWKITSSGLTLGQKIVTSSLLVLYLGALAKGLMKDVNKQQAIMSRCEEAIRRDQERICEYAAEAFMQKNEGLSSAEEEVKNEGTK